MGNEQWTRQFGTTWYEYGDAVSADGQGNVYVSGHTFGSLDGHSAGNFDVFVRKYDAAGIVQWGRQIGTPQREINGGLSADGLGNVYISGHTDGSFGGPSAGGDDAFVVKLADAPPADADFDGDADVDGNDFLAWQRGESPHGLSYVDLFDWRSTFGVSAAPAHSTVPEPSAIALALLAVLAVLGHCVERRQR